jgi:uncharacterized protein (DUF362 family)
MCCDLNRCLYYSDRNGLFLDAPEPVRTVLTVVDGVVAGDGEGPLAPGDVPLGAIVAGTDPVAVDLVAVRLMGFNEQLIPKLCEPMRDTGARITSVREPTDVVVAETRVDLEVDHPVVTRRLDEIGCKQSFTPHPGWLGHIERCEREKT